MYANGDGVLINYVKAHMYWSIAAEKGDQDAINNRDLVSGMMSSVELTKAHVMAQEWLQDHA